MRFKVLAVSSLLLLAVTSALASTGGKEAHPDRVGVLQTSPTIGSGDSTTGPTNPDSQVPSPEWI